MVTTAVCPRCNSLMQFCNKVYECLCCGMRFANKLSMFVDKASLWAQHNFNSMHVYCRLVKLKMPKIWARKFSLSYEKLVHPILYR